VVSRARFGRATVRDHVDTLARMARSSATGALGRAVRLVARAAARGARAGARGVAAGASRVRTAARPAPRAGASGYPGDFDGTVTAVYAPDLDGEPDPGEIVWTWVPFEEDHRRGKDRPVLLVGHDGPWLLGLMLSSRDHDVRPAPPDERWLDLGTGAWDARRRPSEVRLDRVLRIDPQAVRREGAVLDRARFDAVVGSLPASRG
jgi:hypothetical protein